MKLLLVEDDSDDAEFLRLSLAQQNRGVAVTHVTRLADAAATLEAERFDVVLLDLNLPDGRGAECVARIQDADSIVPIVVLSGQGDEDYAVEILNRGVQDYLVKWEGDGRIILRAIRYAIERKRAEVKLNYLARYDALTRVPNRQYLREQLDQARTRALRRGRTMALLQLDLDRFKAVNETLGHEAGDALLREAAQRLAGSIRDGDVLARLGGDEFAVLLEDVDGPLEIEAVARSIGDAFREPFHVGGRDVSVTVSIGITVCPVDGSDTVALLNNADIAMYQAKQQGRNTFKFFKPSMHDEILMHHRLESDLKGALDRGELELLYQPQLRLADHRIDAVEALLRWNHPERGTMSPREFLPIAEETGEIVRLGLWVLEEACRQLQRWEAAGVPVPRVAINVSAMELRQPGFGDTVRRVLESQAVDPNLIELELAERCFTDETGALRDCIRALKNAGVRIAIDDFGAGYSCLKHLQQLRLDVLKIDRSLIAEIGASTDAQVLCSTILSIAHSLSLDAVAEGIETEQQLLFLTRNDCLYGQGFYFSKPLTATEAAAMLAERGGQAARRRRVARKVAGKRD